MNPIPNRQEVPTQALGSKQPIALALMAAMACAVGCSKSKRGGETRWKTLLAADGRSSIRVPSGWTHVTGLNEEATVRAHDDRKDAFVYVYSEVKQDLVNAALRRYCDRSLVQARRRYVAHRELGSRRLTVGSMPALQHTLSLTHLTGVELRQRHICVAGKHLVHRIILSAGADGWPEVAKRFDRIAASFRERVGGRRGNRRPDVSKFVTVTGRSGITTMQVPSDWEDDQLRDGPPDINQAQRSRKRRVAVFVEAKRNRPSITLVAFAQQVLKSLVQKSRKQGGSRAGPPKRLSIQGLPAVQYELTATAHYVKVAYLITVLESPTHYYSIRAWSRLSDRRTSRPVFQRMAASFRLK